MHEVFVGAVVVAAFGFHFWLMRLVWRRMKRVKELTRSPEERKPGATTPYEDRRPDGDLSVGRGFEPNEGLIKLGARQKQDRPWIEM